MSSRVYWPILPAPGSLSPFTLSERSSLQEPGGQWRPTVLLRVPERVQRYSCLHMSSLGTVKSCEVEINCILTDYNLLLNL